MSRRKRIELLLIFVMIFGVIAMFHESRLGRFIDKEVYEFIYSAESFIMTSFMLGFTFIAEVLTMIILSLMVIAVLMILKMRYEALFFALSMIISSILNPVLKNIFDRERPTLLRLIDISGFSFPSGHAMGSSTFFTSIASIMNTKFTRQQNWVITTICGFFILMVSSSRVYLGVHYPTDVLAGIFGGFISVLLSSIILEKLFDNTKRII